jgi:hypothetical protein
MSILKKSSMEVLNDVGLCQEKEDALFKKNSGRTHLKIIQIQEHYRGMDKGK